MNNFVSVFATLFIYVTAGSTFLQAQIPQTLSYQGELTDSSGAPKPDGAYSFTFRLYEIVSGGAAIWSETENLAVKRGLFNTVLGDQSAFEPAVKFDRAYWLGIQVGNDPELSPRIPLTSVGYSFRALRADTAQIAMVTSGDSTWITSGSNVYRLNGNVGIGTANPETKLHIKGGSTTNPVIRLENTYGKKWDMRVDGNNEFALGLSTYKFIIIDSTGLIAIHRGNPQYPLDVNGVVNARSGTNRFVAVQTLNTEGHRAVQLGIHDEENDGIIRVYDQTNTTYPEIIRLTAKPNENSWIINGGNFGIGTYNPTAKLEVAGRTKTCVLEITGGCDLAEPFEISHPEPLPAGALVVIDKDNPGKLKQSTQPYDKRVAGVISGAGGVNPGLTLSQEGMLDNGQHVALTGKVYALASAANGPIEPGDLLTTSETPGYAMKATDFSRAQGAVIGKAMSSLENGEGVVLVLVNLQ